MSTPSDPLPDDDIPFTFEEYLFQMNNDPDFAAGMQRCYAAALALPPGPETEDMQNSARAAIQLHKHYEGAFYAKKALTECMELAKHAPADDYPDLLRRLSALATEA